MAADDLLDLAGGYVRSLEDTDNVEPVGDDEVAEADKLAAEAEDQAADLERRAILGDATPEEAVGAGERAKFTRIRARLTAVRRERYAAAERLRGLDQVGKDAITHAAELPDLKAATEADLATIDKLAEGIRARISTWNETLTGIASRASALHPDPIPPSGIPQPSSAKVGTGNNGAIVVKQTTIKYIPGNRDLADLPAAIGNAVTEIKEPDPSVRLIRGENGLVTTMPADPYGIWQRRIDNRELHELSPVERRAYYDGNGS